MSVSIYSTRVKEMMSRDVVSLHVDATVHEALNLMVDNHVHHLPVVDSSERVVGIVSTMDILSVLADCADDVAHQEVESG